MENTNDLKGCAAPAPKVRKVSIINKALVKKIVHKFGKRVGPGFLHALEIHVHLKIEAACRQYNGGAKTLDSEVAAYVGIKV